MKPYFMYRNLLEARMNKMSIELWQQIDQSAVDDPTKRILRAANFGGDALVQLFGSALRKQGKRSVGEQAWAFVEALGRDHEALAAAHRQSVWTLLGRHYAERWPESWERLVGQAESALGVGHDDERFIARYGPLDGLARTPEPPHPRIEPGTDRVTQFSRFMFRAMERVMGRATGNPIRASEAGIHAFVCWQHAYELGGNIFWSHIEDPTHNKPLSGAPTVPAGRPCDDLAVDSQH